MISNVMDMPFFTFAVKMHDGQMRDEGTPYITHIFYGRSYILTALGHDLLEDTKATFAEISELINSDVAYAIQALTKKSGMSKSDYYGRVAKNSIARPVKVADRLHNLMTMESGGWDKKRIRQYCDVSVKYILPIVAKSTILPISEKYCVFLPR